MRRAVEEKPGTIRKGRRPLRPRGERRAWRRPAPARGPTAAARARAARILAGLKELYPDADCALVHRSALDLLIATILSAQSTDVTVNKVTPRLFQLYRDAPAFAAADSRDLEREIHATGFFRQKTRSLIGACRRIAEAFAGKVPDTMEDLLTLPGVARKTANVVLGTWFKKNEGVVVDTHVGRLAHRLGLTWSSRHEKDAPRIEADLMRLFPREEWTFLGHALIWHGRKVCSARKPNCAGCRLAPDCPSAFTFEEPRGKAKVAGTGRR